MQEHQDFFEQYLGKKADSFFALPQSGSSRINYIGISEGRKYIITYNKSITENDAFFYFSNLFDELDLNTPKILKINQEKTLYIQEFLGDKTLSEVISEEGLSENVKELVRQSLEKLFDLQIKTQNKVDFGKSFEYESYDDLPITHDLYYFKNFLVDVLEIEYQKSTLLKEFRKISEIIQNLSPKSIMIRDFQSRNIMVDNGKVYFIDYQSAMQGPVAYDVISFLYQAKANFPETFRQEMLAYYVFLWEDQKDKDNLIFAFDWIKLIRFLQVLGAYGFRGLIQRKKHFLESLDLGIDNIFELNQNWASLGDNFPELSAVIKKLKDKETQEKIRTLLQ